MKNGIVTVSTIQDVVTNIPDGCASGSRHLQSIAKLAQIANKYNVPFLVALVTLVATWLLRDREWTPTLPLPAVLLTLVIVLSIGEFVRQRFRLSLGTLLIVFTVVAMALGIFGSRWNRARQQRRAVMSIRSIMQQITDEQIEAASRAGAPIARPVTSVWYHKPSSSGGDFTNTPEGWMVPTWLVDLLGDDFFFRTNEASIQLADLSAAHALENVELSHFDSLHFNGCTIGPSAFKRLMSHRELKELHFCDCGITDAHLAEIAKQMPSLEALHLVNFPDSGNKQNTITGDGVYEIAQIETLRHLVLQGLGLRPTELDSLKRLKKIEWLSVPQNPLLTNEDAKVVGSFPILKGANFGGTKVNEDSLLTFLSIDSLEWVTFQPSSPEVEERLSQDQNRRLQIYFH